jgi:hypothetical protein
LHIVVRRIMHSLGLSFNILPTIGSFLGAFLGFRSCIMFWISRMVTCQQRLDRHPATRFNNRTSVYSSVARQQSARQWTCKIAVTWLVFYGVRSTTVARQWFG